MSTHTPEQINNDIINLIKLENLISTKVNFDKTFNLQFSPLTELKLNRELLQAIHNTNDYLIHKL